MKLISYTLICVDVEFTCASIIRRCILFQCFSNKTCLTEKIQKVSKTFTIMSMIDVFSLQCLYNTYIYITLNNTYIFKNSLWRLKINIVVCFFSSYKIYQRFKFALISYILKSFCCNCTNII